MCSIVTFFFASDLTKHDGKLHLQTGIQECCLLVDYLPLLIQLSSSAQGPMICCTLSHCKRGCHLRFHYTQSKNKWFIFSSALESHNNFWVSYLLIHLIQYYLMHSIKQFLSVRSEGDTGYWGSECHIILV